MKLKKKPDFQKNPLESLGHAIASYVGDSQEYIQQYHKRPFSLQLVPLEIYIKILSIYKNFLLLEKLSKGSFLKPPFLHNL